MLVGLPVVQTNSVVEFLKSQPTEFHLTGSRFFQHASDKSDWDFFAQHTKELEVILDGASFRRLIFTSYKDQEIVQVYRHYTGENKRCSLGIINMAIQVDIQLVRQVELKVMAQNWLFQAFNKRMGKIDKFYRNYLWDFAYRMATGQAGYSNDHADLSSGLALRKPNLDQILSTFK
jgi:hypothetical protein